MVLSLFGFQGLVWAINGEMKKTAELTYRGKWVTVFGAVLRIICWPEGVYLVLMFSGLFP